MALAEGSARATAVPEAAPPNGGRAAWVAVFGYFLVCLGTLGVQYAFGTLYSEVVPTVMPHTNLRYHPPVTDAYLPRSSCASSKARRARRRSSDRFARA